MVRRNPLALTIGSEDATVNEFITIPTPQQLGKRAGVVAMNQHSYPVSTRLHLDDMEFIAVEARECGMTRGEFMRWCTVFTAQQLHKRRTGAVRRINP